jgi:hypothetical protein
VSPAARAYDGVGGDAAMRLRSLAFILGFALLVSVPVVAHADDAPIEGVPGSVTTVHSASVRLESEVVQIVVYNNFAECRADFRLVNNGTRRSLRLAFPSVAPVSSEASAYPPDTLGAFHAWRNGRPLAVRVVYGHDGPLGASYYEHDVDLPTGTTTVTVDYLFSTWDSAPDAVAPTLPPAPAQWNDMAGWFESVNYILHTGAMWNGTIGTAVVRVTFDDSCERWGEDVLALDPAVTTPDWTKPDARTFQWVFRDFEPTQDPKTGTSPYDIRLGFARPTWVPVEYEQQQDANAESDLYPDFQWFSIWQNWWRQPFIKDTTQAASVIDMSDYEFTPFGKTTTPFYDLPSEAWAVKGNGTRTWFAATLGGSHRIRELRIVPGLADATYREYSRPKTLVATFSNGTTKTLHLADDPRVQRFPVNVVTNSVRFRVAAIYRGTKQPGLIAVALADVGTTPSPAWLSFADALRMADRWSTIAGLEAILPVSAA